MQGAGQDHAGPGGLLLRADQKDAAMAGRAGGEADGLAVESGRKVTRLLGEEGDVEGGLFCDGVRVEGVKVCHHRGFVDGRQGAPVTQVAA